MNAPLNREIISQQLLDTHSNTSFQDDITDTELIKDTIDPPTLTDDSETEIPITTPVNSKLAPDIIEICTDIIFPLDSSSDNRNPTNNIDIDSESLTTVNDSPT